MKKIKIRTIAALLSALILITSISIVSVSASSSPHVLYDSEISELVDKFEAYYYAKQYVDRLGITDKETANAFVRYPDEYSFSRKSDPNDIITQEEIIIIVRQLSAYYSAKNYLKSKSYSSSIIDLVVKLPDDIIIQAKPTLSYPNGSIAYRDINATSIDENAVRETAQKAYNDAYKYLRSSSYNQIIEIRPVLYWVE